MPCNGLIFQGPRSKSLKFCTMSFDIIFLELTLMCSDFLSSDFFSFYKEPLQHVCHTFYYFEFNFELYNWLAQTGTKVSTRPTSYLFTFTVFFFSNPICYKIMLCYIIGNVSPLHLKRFSILKSWELQNKFHAKIIGVGRNKDQHRGSCTYLYPWKVPNF